MKEKSEKKVKERRENEDGKSQLLGRMIRMLYRRVILSQLTSTVTQGKKESKK